MSVYISPVAEGATPGIGHWLEIRDSLYMTIRRFTLAQQPGQSLDIYNESVVSCSSFLTAIKVMQADFSCSLQRSKHDRSPIRMRSRCVSAYAYAASGSGD